MDNQLLNLDELKNKTISIAKKDGCGNLWLKFLDNTFAIFNFNDITEGFGYSKYEVDLYSYECNPTDDMLINLNLITKDEYELAVQHEELKYLQWREKREKDETERIEKEELELLNKLKLKYKS